MLAKILEKFNHLGWSLYSVKRQQTLDEMVSPGPCSHLHLGEQYLVLPESSSLSNSPKEISDLLHYMEERGTVPAIRCGGREITLLVLSFAKKEVVVYGNPNLYFSYQFFYQHLNTLPCIKAN